MDFMNIFITELKEMAQHQLKEALEIAVSCTVDKETRMVFTLIVQDFRQRQHFYRLGRLTRETYLTDITNIKYRFFSTLQDLRSNDLDKQSVLSLISNVAKEKSLGRIDFSKHSKTDIRTLLSQYKRVYQEQGADTDVLTQIGLCYLELNLFDLAKNTFKQCAERESDRASNYYYLALSIIGKRRLMILGPQEIREILQYLNIALDLKEESYYHLLMANLKQDYFRLNGLRSDLPTVATHLQIAQRTPRDKQEIDRLLRLVPIWDDELLSIMNTK